MSNFKFCLHSSIVSVSDARFNSVFGDRGKKKRRPFYYDVGTETVRGEKEYTNCAARGRHSFTLLDLFNIMILSGMCSAQYGGVKSAESNLVLWQLGWNLLSQSISWHFYSKPNHFQSVNQAKSRSYRCYTSQ